MNPKSDRFKALQAKWDKKLKESGFEDIENRNETLKAHHSFRFLRRSGQVVPPEQVASFNAAKQEYYRMAGHFLHEYQFETQLEWFIWERHSQGLSEVQIFKALHEKKIPIYLNKVKKIKVKLRTKMFEMYRKTHE